MNGVSNLGRERLHDADDTPSAADVRRSESHDRSSNETAMRDAIARLPMTTDYGVLVSYAAATPRTATSTHATAGGEVRGKALSAPQKALDDFRDRFSGPYKVDGQSVSAPPMFRMNLPTAFNASSAQAHAPQLAEICRKAGIASMVGPASVGRPTPEQLVRVTQALIDAGQLPPADKQHATVAERIKAMQWEWGVGVDCAGYTQQAAAAAHPRAAHTLLSNVNGDIFSNMKNDGRFEKVKIDDISPGDVLHLDATPVGHNVICRSHSMVSDADRAKFASASGISAEARGFLAGKGPFHAIEVDSSWGAGNGSMVGGFRRDTWICDESTQKWASFPAGNQTLPLQFDTTTGGPQGEKFAGAFRPKEQ